MRVLKTLWAKRTNLHKTAVFEGFSFWNTAISEWFWCPASGLMAAKTIDESSFLSVLLVDRHPWSRKKQSNWQPHAGWATAFTSHWKAETYPKKHWSFLEGVLLSPPTLCIFWSLRYCLCWRFPTKSTPSKNITIPNPSKLPNMKPIFRTNQPNNQQTNLPTQQTNPATEHPNHLSNHPPTQPTCSRPNESFCWVSEHASLALQPRQ